QLRRAQREIKILQHAARCFGPALAALNHRLKLRVADLHEREFRRDKEAIHEHENEHGKQPPEDRHHLVKIHNRTFPKIAWRISWRLTTPASRPSRPRTMASRCPARWRWRIASSSRISTSRNAAGFT